MSHPSLPAPRAKHSVGPRNRPRRLLHGAAARGEMALPGGDRGGHVFRLHSGVHDASTAIASDVSTRALTTGQVNALFRTAQRAKGASGAV